MSVTYKTVLGKTINFLIAFGLACALTCILIDQFKSSGDARYVGLAFMWAVAGFTMFLAIREIVRFRGDATFRPFTSHTFTIEKVSGPQVLCDLSGFGPSKIVIALKPPRFSKLHVVSMPKQSWYEVRATLIGEGVDQHARQFKIKRVASDFDDSVTEHEWKIESSKWRAALQLTFDPIGDRKLETSKIAITVRASRDVNVTSLVD